MKRNDAAIAAVIILMVGILVLFGMAFWLGSRPEIDQPYISEDVIVTDKWVVPGFGARIYRVKLLPYGRICYIYYRGIWCEQP